MTCSFMFYRAFLRLDRW